MQTLPALILTMLLATACGTSGTTNNKEPVDATVATSMKRVAARGPVDGHQRLADDVVPTRYTLNLTLDPSKDTFEGTVIIDLKVQRPTVEFRMHADGPKITAAMLLAGGGVPKFKERKRYDVRVEQGKNGGLAVRSKTPIQPGAAQLKLTFTAPLPETPTGIYRVKSGADWYAFTQFEPLEARRAFPCFDQPEFKTPFDTTLRVKKGDLPLTNGPESSRRNDGPYTVVSFAPTLPIPTYLVAFAVGPFDVVEAPAQKGLPKIRTITTRGKGKLATWANVTTAKALLALQDYFGEPYPYAKLDQVAVPNFASGAMENVGLVTYRERLLLLGDGKDAPPTSKMWATVVIAHELGHMWFGNKVTLAWWNDIWLNEAFATWISFKITQTIAPEFEAPLALSSSILRTMSWDAQAASRAIRQPIAHGGDVYNAFDPITYRKGAGVLTMLEAWLGEDTFRTAVRAYIAAHAHGIATTPDLLAALTKTSGKDVSGVVAKFLDQPGTPLVSVKLKCDAGAAPTLALAQTRYLPAASKTAKGDPWRIPMCVRFGTKGGPQGGTRHCTEFSGPTGTITLPTKTCPTWVHPNDQERGYYRWSLEPKLLLALLGPHRGSLTVVEKAAMANHLVALLESNTPAAAMVAVPAMIKALKALSKETHQQVVKSLVAPLMMLARHVPEEQRAAFSKRVVKPVLGRHMSRLGFTTKPNPKATSFSDGLLRPTVSKAFFDLMRQNKKLRSSVSSVAAKALADFKAVTPAMFATTIPLAGREGGPAFVAELSKNLSKAPTPAHRVAMVRAMGAGVKADAVVAGLEKLLDGSLRAQDVRELRRYSSAAPEAVQAGWDWMKTHFEALTKLVGTKSARGLVWFGSDLCTAAQQQDFRTFFGDAARDKVGVKRMVGVVGEIIGRCIRMRAALQPALKKALGKR